MNCLSDDNDDDYDIYREDGLDDFMEMYINWWKGFF